LTTTCRTRGYCWLQFSGGVNLPLPPAIHLPPTALYDAHMPPLPLPTLLQHACYTARRDGLLHHTLPRFTGSCIPYTATTVLRRFATRWTCHTPTSCYGDAVLPDITTTTTTTWFVRTVPNIHALDAFGSPLPPRRVQWTGRQFSIVQDGTRLHYATHAWTYSCMLSVWFPPPGTGSVTASGLHHGHYRVPQAGQGCGTTCPHTTGWDGRFRHLPDAGAGC